MPSARIRRAFREKASATRVAALTGGLVFIFAATLAGGAGARDPGPSALSATAQPQPKPRPVAETKGTGIIRFSNTYPEASGYERFSYVLVAPHYARQAARLPATTLPYTNASTLYQAWSTGVAYKEAVDRGWLLEHADGRPFMNARFNGFVPDLGNRAYQQRFVANVTKFLRAHGNDGVFIDDVLASPTGYNGGFPAKYPDNPSWEEATMSFVSYVGPALRAKGFYVLVNAAAYHHEDPARDNGASYARFYKRLAPYVDGIMNEYWVQSTEDVAQLRSVGTDANDYWEGWQQLVSVTQKAGADFFGLTYGSGDDRRAIRYGRASFLLDWDGRGGAFMWVPTDRHDPYHEVFVKDLGRPVAPKSERRTGVWQRTYRRGVVLLNATDAAVTVRLGERTLTIPPTDAVFARAPKP